MTLPEDADQMIKACDKYGAKLFVVKQNRYNLPVVKLRQEFEAGAFWPACDGDGKGAVVPYSRLL